MSFYNHSNYFVDLWRNFSFSVSNLWALLRYHSQCCIALQLPTCPRCHFINILTHKATNRELTQTCFRSSKQPFQWDHKFIACGRNNVDCPASVFSNSWRLFTFFVCGLNKPAEIKTIGFRSNLKQQLAITVIWLYPSLWNCLPPIKTWGSGHWLTVCRCSWGYICQMNPKPWVPGRWFSTGGYSGSIL